MTFSNERPRIEGGENPDNIEHWDIYRAFNPQDTTDANDAAGKFTTIATQWNADVTIFAARLQRSSAAAWDGQAAEASREAVRNYTQRAVDLTPTLQSLARQVSTAITGITNTKKNVAEPNSGVGWNIFNPKGWSIGDWDGPRSRDGISEARDKARAAMRDHYLVDFKSADSQIPELPRAVNPTSPLYNWQPGTSGVPGPSTAGVPVTPGTQPDSPEGTAAQPTTQGQDSGTAQDSGSTEPAATNSAAATDDSAATTPTGVDPNAAATRPSSAGGSGSGGIPGGGLGGLTGGSTPGGGRSVPGAPGSGTAGNAAAAAARAGAAGMPGTGMPGMGGAGGKGKGEEDESTHAIPDWLKNMENAEELLGEVPKTIPGGVIGGDYADPRPPDK
ncbi:WXG100 family type VII secretion target [Nocardia blacklockiae]|uniref:WXG100 family type VII secretion target n=1 Tax=Nocardia blacklockiae TaxID=480036 RepID=UPI0018957DCB|nr:hypothetical protein [Nocardia blacklockiae]MBF6172611.1 hypothetical protein [Nocardia blacklockiae]